MADGTRTTANCSKARLPERRERMQGLEFQVDGLECLLSGFISVAVTNSRARSGLRRKDFIWRTIAGYDPSFLGNQGRNLRGWSHHTHSQEQRGVNVSMQPAPVKTMVKTNQQRGLCDVRSHVGRMCPWACSEDAYSSLGS